MSGAAAIRKLKRDADRCQQTLDLARRWMPYWEDQVEDPIGLTPNEKRVNANTARMYVEKWKVRIHEAEVRLEEIRGQAHW